MAVTEREISNTFEWLKNTKHVTVNIEWLEACVSWLKSRGNAYTQLKNDVYRQWLTSDLGQSGSHCLPDQISTLPKTFILGVVALQMNSIVNIGASAYSQVKKLKNDINEDTSVDENRNQAWQPKPCRMLKLELTDGEQTIEGMEYQSMKKLSTDLIPGTKILIKANTLCRSGMLFLTDDNVEILGGQVQQLIGENSQMNILHQLVMKSKGAGHNDGVQTEGNTNERLQNNYTAAGQYHERLQNGIATRPSHSNLHNNYRNPPEDHEDFEALLSEDDDFIAELDGNINPGELDGHINHPSTSTSTSTQPQTSTQMINIDDDIPDDVLQNINDVENIAQQDATDDELIRNIDESDVQWHIDDDDDDDFW